MNHEPRYLGEQGYAIATAIALLGIMLTTALATFSLVDTQSKESRHQRERESGLALSEGVLYAQGFVLAKHWPGPDKPPYPTSCNSANPASAVCPTASTLAGAAGSGANFTNVDQIVNATWTTRVRDNGGTLAEAYSTGAADSPQTVTRPDGTVAPCSTSGGPCTRDFNDDKALWVEARGLVRGKPRRVVALLKLEELAEDVPRAAVTAGAISTGNSGGNTIISGTPAPVIVRCDPTKDPVNSSGNDPRCASYSGNQIVPAPTYGLAKNLMDAGAIARFRDRAIVDGRYFAGCPAKDPAHGNSYYLTGAVVFVEGCTTPPNFTNSVYTAACNPAAPSGDMSQKCINQITKPGLLIWHCGRADFSGGFTFVGVIYMANDSDNTCTTQSPPLPGARGDGKCKGQNAVDESRDVLTTSGGFGLWGAIAVDGQGCVKVNANGFQIKYDPNVFNAVRSYGTVGLVQNTWRELPPS